MTSILEKLSVRRVALPISVEQYHRLGREGIIGQRTELLRGVIIERMTKSPLHTYVVHVIARWLQENIEADQHLRKEEPLTFADSEPEPDIAVVSGQPEAYRACHPATADLVVEVAIASVGLDRDKGDIYAAAGVPEYWVVIPEERAVEIYRDPTGNGYAVCERLTAGESLLKPQRAARAAIRLATLFA